MTKGQLNQIRQLAEDYNGMHLFGFTSTSRFRSVAETFAYDDPAAGLQKCSSTFSGTEKQATTT